MTTTFKSLRTAFLLFAFALKLIAGQEITATQLEFPFANGASVQTPGVTTDGETFVKVVAGPQNLKFGSTSLSGAQPSNYAFPRATFDAIGQDPAALKNFRDLPGAAPQYIRTLQPPPGALIQRDIVPGGKFGGGDGALTQTNDSYFDPQVEFEELAVVVNGQRTWKVMGPDLSGAYGALNGVGGLEATVRESDGFTTPVLNDCFGNVLADISGVKTTWNSTRVSGYGFGYLFRLFTHRF